MRAQHLLFSLSCLAPILVMAGASCSASNDTTSFEAQASAASGAGGATTTTNTTADTGVGGGFGVGGGGGAGPELVAEVYGNSPDTLYRLDPDALVVTTVGLFQGCTSVVDIALDKDSNLYGATFDGLYAIDRATAVCSLIALGAYPNSLSFVPAGTLDPNKEVLVGYQDSVYVRIDTVTGLVTPIGGLSGGLSSSGDIVSVKNGKTLLTVNGANCNDCLIEVDPKTGDLVKDWGPVGFDSVFGLAFWAGSAYGFNKDGELFQIDFTNNVVSTQIIPIPGNPSLVFWGAGSTTSAPPEPIPE